MGRRKVAKPSTVAMTGRVLYPATGFTLDDAVAYYRAMAKVLLPHLRNRPLSFRRYVDAVDREFFWEKDAPSFTPDWVKTFPVPRREGGSPIRYVIANDQRTLLWIIRSGGIELHPFLHRVPRIEVATDVVFDLDPGEGAGLRQCARVALLLRDALAALGLRSFAKVSGSKGMQVYVPLHSGATHETTETFARLVAGELARQHPKLVVAKMAKALRRGKVFIDWSQNADYKTTVAVYSLRAAHEQPYVSMPVRWEELDDPDALWFTPEQAIARVRKVGDLFAEVVSLEQTLGLSASPPPLRRSGGARRAPGNRHAGAPVLPGSQSGRRLFLITRTETGSELWIDMRGRFRRFILRPDREGAAQLIAMPAGEFAIDPEYYRGEVPEEWKGRVTIEDRGVYEIVEGSWERGRFALWFTGRVLSGAWTLEKISAEKGHRSWRLAPDTRSSAGSPARRAPRRGGRG